MEKKQYIAPSVEIFMMKQESLLAASVTGNGMRYGGDASDNGVTETDSKYFFDDDDDDYWE